MLLQNTCLFQIYITFKYLLYHIESFCIRISIIWIIWIIDVLLLFYYYKILRYETTKKIICSIFKLDYSIFLLSYYIYIVLLYV